MTEDLQSSSASCHLISNTPREVLMSLIHDALYDSCSIPDDVIGLFFIL
jgi:hypothetical protein